MVVGLVGGNDLFAGRQADSSARSFIAMETLEHHEYLFAILWIDASDFDSGLFNGVDMGNSFSAKRVIGNTFSITPVPLPAAVWLFICGLMGLMGLLRKIRRI